MERKETNSFKRYRVNDLASATVLVMNLKKSPWLLSRCKNEKHHLNEILEIIEPNDTVRVVVRLSTEETEHYRYLVLVTRGNEKPSQNLILGLDVLEKSFTIGIILPITKDMDICLNGDGGFYISSKFHKYFFHPKSIQEMWSALQCLISIILCPNTEPPSSIWIEYYEKQNQSAADLVRDWMLLEEFESQPSPVTLFSRNMFCNSDCVQLALNVKRKLRELMMEVDLENVTSKIIREKLEALLGSDLHIQLNMTSSQYKHFIDEEMVVIMRQMDSPSQILDHLYLGSEWNASNLEELQSNGIGYILNVSREIENFFPGMFKYCNVRVYDHEETELLRHWNQTYQFIDEARTNNSKILVHCKMGVSRSASTVIAYLMKGLEYKLEEAYQHVKHKRGCVKPNPGFMKQLIIYQGILDASNRRKLFRSQSTDDITEVFEEKYSWKKRPFSDTETFKLFKANNIVEGELNDMPIEPPSLQLSDKFSITEKTTNSSCLTNNNNIKDNNFKRNENKSDIVLHNEDNYNKNEKVINWSIIRLLSDNSKDSDIITESPRIKLKRSLDHMPKKLDYHFRSKSVPKYLNLASGNSNLHIDTINELPQFNKKVTFLTRRKSFDVK